MLALPRRTLTNLLKTRCPNCIKQQSYATRKRFYRTTSVIQNEQKWEIALDHRRLKTPNGCVLAVENEMLARAIAAEWDAQNESISRPTMHLTALCNTAVDNPGKCTSHDIVSYILDYISTDTLLFYSGEEDELRLIQEQKWTPILEWFKKRYDVKQQISTGFNPPNVTNATRAKLAKNFLSYNFPSLTAISFGVEALKSPILMLACIERCLEPYDAVLLSRLEEEYQLARWGRVPWAHELNQAELTSRVAAAVLVVTSSHDRQSVKKKKPVNAQSFVED